MAHAADLFPGSRETPAALTAWKIIVPHRPGYVHLAALLEMVDGVLHGLRPLVASVELAFAGPEVPENAILIGAHLLSAGECDAVPNQAIVYNSEHANSPWIGAHYRALLRRTIVWDFSLDNARMLENLLNKPVLYVKLGYVPVLTRVQPDATQDIDVLFYGSGSPRRAAVLDALRDHGLTVHHAFAVYFADRDALIARAKIVLNVHAYLPGAFEIVRVSYLLANRKAVVCECNAGERIDADLLDGVVAAPYEDIVARTIELANDAKLREAIGERGYHAFAGRDQAAILRNALGERIARPAQATIAASPASPPRLAAVTMAYNDPIFLPIWRRHYGAAVGEHNLFVLDHGSDDGSTDDLGAVNRLRVPRGDFDEDQRSTFVSRFHASLLCYYDAVIFSDADEMLVPDPAKFTGLADFINRRRQSFVTAIGIEIQHVPGLEADIDLAQPVLAQRQYGRFAADYCKPLISRIPLAWDPGFHSCDHPSAIDRNLFLFHLKAMDYRLALAQVRQRRHISWTGSAIGKSQGVQFRMDDEAFTAKFFPITAETLAANLADGFDFTADLARLVTGHPHVFQNFKGAVRKIPDRFHHAIAGPRAIPPHTETLPEPPCV